MAKRSAGKKAARKQAAKRAAKKTAARGKGQSTAASEPLGATIPVERVPLERINPAPYNPSVPVEPGGAGFEKLKKSFEQFGQVQPLVWNRRTGNLVGGHQALIVMRHLHPGITHVDCRVVELDPVSEKALNIRLNRRATTDDPIRLGEALQELVDAEIDTELTGLDEQAVQKEIAAMEAALGDGEATGSAEPASSESSGRTGSHDRGEAADQSDELKDTYKVVVTCANEQDQQALLGRLESEGYQCRALIA